VTRLKCRKKRQFLHVAFKQKYQSLSALDRFTAYVQCLRFALIDASAQTVGEADHFLIASYGSSSHINRSAVWDVFDAFADVQAASSTVHRDIS